jgi:sec-independent protein translocase protein TatA
MPFRLGPLEIGLILVIVLIVFGVGKLPQVGGALGKSIREFKRSRDGDAGEGGRILADKAEVPTLKS